MPDMLGAMMLKLTVRKAIEATDALGGKAAPTYVTICQPWGERISPRMRERWLGEGLQNTASCTFRIHYRNDLTPDMQVVCESVIYDITGLYPVEFRQWLLIDCQEMTSG